MESDDLLGSQDYQTLLKKLYLLKKKRNPRYSARSFAKFLGISHSFLLRIWSGKKDISLDLANSIASKIDAGNSVAILFMDLVRKKIAPSSAQSSFFQRPSAQDIFILSSWYYPVIVKLGAIDSIALTPSVAAKALKLPETEMEAAFKELEERGFLKKNEQGFYKSKPGELFRDQDLNESYKKFLFQMFEKAKSAIQERPGNEYVVHSLVFELKQSRLPVLSQRLASAVCEIISEEQNSSAQMPEDPTIFSIGLNIIPLAAIGK